MEIRGTVIALVQLFQNNQLLPGRGSKSIVSPSQMAHQASVVKACQILQTKTHKGMVWLASHLVAFKEYLVIQAGKSKGQLGD